MGRHPVAVVNLHITYARTMKVDYSRFSLGGLHGKHVVVQHRAVGHITVVVASCWIFVYICNFLKVSYNLY
jgi:hypothetical protein